MSNMASANKFLRNYYASLKASLILNFMIRDNSSVVIELLV